MGNELLGHLLRRLQVVDGIGVYVGKVIVEPHAQFYTALGEDDLGRRQPSELHLGKLVVVLQSFTDVLEDTADSGLGQCQNHIQ